MLPRGSIIINANGKSKWIKVYPKPNYLIL